MQQATEVREGDLRPIKNIHYVYSLNCKDGYYIGCTNDLKDRIQRHEKGQVSATADRLPIEFKSIKAEICANADCYRFIHPRVFL